MHKIGMTELLVILAIALVIFGPKALPKLGRSIGKTIAMFKKGVHEQDDDDDDDDDEPSTKKSTTSSARSSSADDK